MSSRLSKACCTSRPVRTMHGFTVSYDSSNHFQVLLQQWGSVWPRVIPYCIFNLTVSIVLQYTQGHGFDWRVTDKGHQFLTMLVSFLVVMRVTVSLAKYSSVRESLKIAMCVNRQLVDEIAVHSSSTMNPAAKLWRHDVIYLALLQLRSIMCVINYETDGIPFWELPLVEERIVNTLKSNLFVSTEAQRQYAHHAEVSECEENMRVPVRLAFMLRETIISQRKRLEKPFSPVHELKLLKTVDGIMSGFYGIRSFLTTPFPFPLVQMSRTFLFFYLFTIPFALLSDTSKPIAHSVVVFFLTFGFMGIESVAIELDDPFGRDSNDFDNSRMAQLAYEDAYLIVLDMDGEEWTDKLRKKMDGAKTDGAPIQADYWLHRSVEV